LCVQVVCPKYKSLYESLRHDLQLTCFVLTVAIYGCSVAVVTWPRHDSSASDCRRVASRYGDVDDDDRAPWTGRSFEHNKRISSSSSEMTGDVVTPVVRSARCQSSSESNFVSTLTLTWCSLIAVIYLLYVAEYYYNNNNNNYNSCIYVVECWFSPYRRRFSDKRRRVVDTRAAYDLVTSLRNALPVIRWTAVSYHYIRSAVASVSVTSPLRQHKYYKQRVVTHRATSLFHCAPDELVDRSLALVDLESFPVTWLRITCQFSFGSASARREFARQRDAFCAEQRTRDQHVDFRQTLSLLGALSGGGGGGHIVPPWSREMAVCNPDVRPWYSSVAVYWLASLLTLSWPLRVVLQWRTATLDYTVYKVFDCRRHADVTASRDHRDNDDVISVTSLENSSNSASSSSVNSDSISSDSVGLVDTDCALAPSYSQAILMDTRTLDDRKPLHHHHQPQQQQQQCQQWRRGCYIGRLRRVQSCLTSFHRDVTTTDVKPSPSLTTHLHQQPAAILMTSRPPSYNTAMCIAGHVTDVAPTPVTMPP